MIKKEYAEVKDYHRTMGYAEVHLESPAEFLKIGNGIRPDPVTPNHKCFRRNIPPVPKLQPKRAQSAPPKNFKLKNIHEANALTSRKPVPRYVDTCRGDFHELKTSGLTPVYVKRPTFGRVPKYLKKRIKELQMDEEIARQKEINQQPLCRYVTQNERDDVLNGLRYNWNDLQRKYQSLSIITDTLTKKMRKLTIESQLKQLEKDILLIEQNPHIYVYTDEKPTQ